MIILSDIGQKLLFSSIGIALSSAVAWLVIFPYVVVPRIGGPDQSTPQLASLMLAGFIFTFIIVGATIRSFREFALISIASGIMLKIAETLSALIFPFASQRPLNSPIEEWTIGLLFSVAFAALILLIGLPFGWVFRYLQRTEN